MTNATLNAYYADMNDREVATKTQEAVEASERNYATLYLEHVQEVADEYAYTLEGHEEDGLPNAFARIAAFFHNADASNVGDDDRSYNALAFQQRGVLQNICNNAKWMLENALKHQTDLYTKLDQLEATYDDGEISSRNLNYCLDQIERSRNVQVPACEDWFSNAKSAYEAIVGEKWAPYVKAGKPAERQSSDAIRARIEALRA